MLRDLNVSLEPVNPAEPTSPDWDSFLLRTPEGQFQQSTAWAAAKAFEGWQAARTELREDNVILGGFQLLYRRRRGAKIGYVSKGPVQAEAKPGLRERLQLLLKQTAGQLRLAALVVQPPDRALNFWNGAAGFEPNVVLDIIEATQIIDLADRSPDSLWADLSTGTQRKIRRAQNRGVKIHEGTIQDVPAFFNLMLATCRRQQVKPNPASIDQIYRLWNHLGAGDHVRLTFAAVGENPVSAQIVLHFGDTASLWKVGWSGDHPEACPNHLLRWESIKYAAEAGAKRYDFMSFPVDAAKAALLAGAPFPDLEKTRQWFHIGFGGKPVLLPPARLYLPSKPARLTYRFFCALRGSFRNRR